MARRRSPSLPEWQDTLAFTLVDPERNRYRSYHLRLTRDLFGNWAIIRTWGRIGKYRREQVDYFRTVDEAMEHATRLGRRRLLHGYELRHRP